MTISPFDDIIDVRDIIAHVENEDSDIEDVAELSELLVALRDVGGGDEQWRGDWYPLTLIRDSYFVTYAQELAEDIGAVNPDAGWPNGCIDWERAARDLRMDYTSVEYLGVTYWTR